MSEYLASRIDLYALGAATVTCTCSSGSAAITLAAATTSRYYHGDSTDDSDDGTAPANGGTDAFGPAFKIAFDASALTETLTITFDPLTGYYTLTPSAGNLALTFAGDAAGTLMKHLLGMTGDRTAAASLTSQACPWYYLILPDKTDPTPREVLDDAFRGEINIGSSGQPYGIGPARVPYGRSWRDVGIEKEIALNRYGGDNAWTLERFFEYHRTGRRWLHFEAGTTVMSYANREAVYAFTKRGIDGWRKSLRVPHWVRYYNVDFDVVEHTSGPL